MKSYDFVLRFCGAIGWIGILKDEYGEELYRTGKHCQTAEEALRKLGIWKQEGLLGVEE
jgi:hypothetical protein